MIRLSRTASLKPRNGPFGPVEHFFHYGVHMFFINDAWAAGEAAAPGGMEGFLIQVVPLIVIFAVFWFFLIRPQQKRQKEHMKMCDALAKGDEVMTLGGLNGRIDFVEDQTIGLQVASVDGKPVVVRMQRNAVQMVLPKGSIKF